MAGLLKTISLFLLCCVATVGTAQNLRVMSFNVRNARGMDNRFDFDRTASVIRRAKPDVVAVQELDSMTTRNRHYVLGELAERTGYNDYYAPTINYRGGKYGIGVLSKSKALSTKSYPLPCRKEPRAMIVVEFADYYLICTHLSLVREDRLRSVEIIREVVEQLPKPVFVVGDMNALPESPTIKAFSEFMQVLSDTTKPTFSSTEPTRCIDYIFGRGAKFIKPRTTVIDDKITSDHRPLYVDVKVKR
ncbi:MAG: endonuclease/exonuclease/phosphatase family protein [Alistipes sp.]|nr:endonuclease/exonuclease/phosphatase family protein [Alistipes sp.]